MSQSQFRKRTSSKFASFWNIYCFDWSWLVELTPPSPNIKKKKRNGPRILKWTYLIVYVFNSQRMCRGFETFWNRCHVRSNYHVVWRIRSTLEFWLCFSWIMSFPTFTLVCTVIVPSFHNQGVSLQLPPIPHPFFFF